MTRWLGLLLLSAALPAGAHPFHESQAEIDYRAECSCLEISLRLKPEELEAALQRARAPRLPLEDARMLPALKGYVLQNFVVNDGAGKSIELQWIGLQVDALGAWVYLQSPAVRLPLQLRNEILLEQEAEQVNRVMFRVGEQRQSLRFARDAARVQWLGKEETPATLQ